MKHTFFVRYELDTPLAIAVAIYLDSEHYIFLHRGLTNKMEITGKGNDYYTCHQTWNILGLNVGQSYTCKYIAPATFINCELTPFPKWFPSIHHLVKTRTTLRYFENPERRTTLSELEVEMEMPFWLYPFRHFISATIEKMKILKDLEDVALFDRRARLFGRDSNEVYLKRHQFMLHKEDYLKWFGENSRLLGNPDGIYKYETWTNIKDLDRPYVREFLEKKYKHYTNFVHEPLPEPIPQAVLNQ